LGLQSNESTEYVKEIGPFEALIQPGCKVADTHSVLHSIAPLNMMLIVTYLNVYHNVEPTIAVCGAPARKECCDKNVVVARVTPECRGAGATVHPQCLMTETYISKISAEDQARMSQTLLLANGPLPYQVTLPFQSYVCEKWAGSYGMTQEDLEAKNRHLFNIRSRGGKVSGRANVELRRGFYSPDYAEEVEVWNAANSQLSSQRQLNLLASGKHNFHKPEVQAASIAARNAGTRGEKRKTCSVDGCTSLAKKGGVCWRHGAKEKFCSHEGCTNQARQGGVCITHGAIIKQCSVDGCTNQVVKGGVCKRHGAKAKRKICSHEGCTNQARKGGVCITHGAKY